MNKPVLSSGMADVSRVWILLLAVALAVQAEDWPQWLGPNRDGSWGETGVLETFPPGGLEICWRAAVGVGFSSPVVVRGRVYLTDSELAEPEAHERVHAFDAKTGKPLWTYRYKVNYPAVAFDKTYLRGPIATPVVAGGRLYTFGAAGDLYCFDATTGSVLWQKDVQKDYPTNQLYISASPLIEGDLLILLAGAKPGATVIAFDKRTGKEVWKALDEPPTASSPVVVSAAGKRQLIVWSPESVTALGPATGKIYWRQALKSTQDAAVSTPVYHNGYLLVGALMFKLDRDKPGAMLLWPQTQPPTQKHLSDTSTALFRDDFIYSARTLGKFVCLEAKTGKQVWETDRVTDSKNGASIHLAANGHSVLLYNDRGELIRARLTPEGYQEISRARVLEPALTFGGRKCAWAAPAFAHRHIYARTNKELVCASLEP
jgi:outer membrane protein assembly factor BamB